jgi:hypothetical protein
LSAAEKIEQEVGTSQFNSVWEASMTPPTLTLNDTDFERPLKVIFQISEWPGKNAGQLTEQMVKDKLNQDFLWSSLTDKLLSKEESAYEKYYGLSAQFSYDRLREIANGTRSWTYYDDGAVMWTGEVGQWVFARQRAAPRDIMWTLHNDKTIARKVRQNNLHC